MAGIDINFNPLENVCKGGVQSGCAVGDSGPMLMVYIGPDDCCFKQNDEGSLLCTRC